MTYEFYKIVHLLGIMLLFTTLGGMATLVWLGASETSKAQRGFLAMLHGIALVIVFVAGFGLQARMAGGGGWPVWLILKIVIWAVLAAMLTFIRRSPDLGKLWILILPAIGGLAGYLAIFKPL